MRRKANSLVPLEVSILQGSVEFARSGDAEFHGYAMAKALKDEAGAKQLTAHGTLYRALERLERLGFLASRWEDPAVAAQEQRPLRRLYHITAAGHQACQAAIENEPAPARKRPMKKGLAPS
jgi:DNA-binding PadR family transcriptional regulator